MLTKSQLSDAFNAMQRRDLKVALQLVESNATPNYVFFNEEIGLGTRLIDVAVDLGDVSTIQRLIELGADVQRAEDGGVPLVDAAGLGHREIVEMLLRAGADVNALRDSEEETGETALMGAAGNKGADIVRILLAAGANAGLLDGSSQSGVDPV